jgi:hypothetical protein
VGAAGVGAVRDSGGEGGAMTLGLVVWCVVLFVFLEELRRWL